MARRRRTIVAGVLALIGGATIIAGCFLVWLDLGEGIQVGTTSVASTANGNELLLGKIALASGIAIIVFGLLSIAISRARKVLGLLIFVGGLVAAGSVAYVVWSPQARYVDFATSKYLDSADAESVPEGQSDEVKASLSRLLEVTDLRAGLSGGPYVVIGGGAVSVLAGLAGVFGQRKRPEPEDDLAELEPTVETQDEDRAVVQQEHAPGMAEASRDPEAGQDVEGSVWERSFDDAERSVDRVEDQPAAPPGADPEEDHTAGEAEEPPAPQRKDVLGDSWVG